MIKNFKSQYFYFKYFCYPSNYYCHPCFFFIDPYEEGKSEAEHAAARENQEYREKEKKECILLFSSMADENKNFGISSSGWTLRCQAS